MEYNRWWLRLIIYLVVIVFDILLFHIYYLFVAGAISVGIELFFLIQKKRYNSNMHIQAESFIIAKNAVVVVTAKQPHIYQLEENIHFDAERMELIKEEQIVKFTSQMTILLEMFLKAEDHKLSVSEISESLWPDGTGTKERIHTLIRRLRKSIGELTDFQIKFRNDFYYLIFPISSRKMP